MISKSITIETNLSQEEVLNAITSKLNPKSGLFARNIISIISTSDHLHGLVNIPYGFDPFKNHVRIRTTRNNNFSTLNVKLHFGISMMIMLAIFPVLIFFTSGGMKNVDLGTILIGFGFSLFLYFLFRLKLIGDFKRVKNWIIEECKIAKLNK